MSHTKHTFVFKHINNLDLLVDVYIPSTSPFSDDGYPVIFHMHGGGLVIGDRNTFTPVFSGEAIKRNWAFVSFDYRLAPEVKIDEIWSDCEDAYKWLLNDATSLTKTALDTNKIALYGASAGGLLVLIGGYKLTPRPKVIIDFYGLCNLLNSFYSTPQKISDPANAIPDSVGNSTLDHPVSGLDPFKIYTLPRMKLYQYLIQKGTFIEQTMGLDIHKQSDVEKLISWSPSRNITTDFPPTFIVHGNKDCKAPFSDSFQLAEELTKNGVINQFIVADGQDHGFDLMLKLEDQQWNTYVEPALTFLEKHLQ